MTNNLYYHSRWDILAIEFKLNNMILLIPDELHEQNNIYRVLTSDWEYIGEL
jgi:hypothetical protein